MIHGPLAAVLDASQGRLVAALGAELRDLWAAEEALSDAVAEALVSWPRDGVPQRPEGWLLTVARRRAIDRLRQRGVEAAARHLAAEQREWFAEVEDDAEAIPDRRLALLFVCAHPAIDPVVRAPLMLQTVLGWEAGRIAGLFLVAPSTMSQRLVRAKIRIREARIPFEIPGPDQWASRLTDVLAAMYAVFTAGADGDDPEIAPCAEAIRLVRLLVDLQPQEPEALGLLALLLLVQAKSGASRDADGAYVPLSAQDPQRWDRRHIAAAETYLRQAATLGQPSRYQLEAAIQSAHTSRGLGMAVPDEAILALYDGLLAAHPSIGAMLGRCAVVARLEGPAAGLWELSNVPKDLIANHQPAWALRGDLLDRLGDSRRAAAAFTRAAALSRDPSIRRWLLGRIRR
jgi:RNA polymerase sigma-70 factor (ECF subfamily)